MGLALVTPAETEPVDLQLAKSHLRVDGSDEDALIAALLAAAAAHVEDVTCRALAEQTWALTLPGFPADGVIRLPKPPLQAVVGISYRDEAGTEQLLPAATYVVETGSLPGQVTRAAAAAWPATAIHPEAVRIEFTCGYGASAPAALTAAILLLLGDLYANREAAIVGTIRVDNPAVGNLLAPFRYLEAV